VIVVVVKSTPLQLSGFRDSVDLDCGLVGYGAMLSGMLLPMFQGT
jgi:hypothetical protein